MILAKFGAKESPHCTFFPTDRDKGLNLSNAFKAMIVEADFTVELTKPDSSDQNAVAERPHCDLGQSNLGPQYLSYALQQAVFIRNNSLIQNLGPRLSKNIRLRQE